MKTIPAVRDDRQQGQIIVLFALALVAIIAAVGLVLDGGGAYAQRRDEQSAADLAALAGANDYLLNDDTPRAIARAKLVASDNGFTDGVGGVTVNVDVATTNGALVTVNISAPHPNSFAGVVGMRTWTVSTTATAQSGFPDTVAAGGPILFSIDAFDSEGHPLSQYGNPSSPFDFGETNGDIPTSASDLAWTNYGTGNVDSSGVRNIIEGSLVINKTIDFGEYIGQHNNGNHTTLYTSINNLPTDSPPGLRGEDIPVPVVDHNGNFMGWATFHVTSADGSSNKHITGYFVDPYVHEQLSVGNCSAGSCPRYLGSYVLKLTN